MARITVEDCLEKIPNRFQLVLAATYRARMLSQGHAPRIESRNKPAVTALREIAEGKVGLEMLRKVPGLTFFRTKPIQKHRASGAFCCPKVLRRCPALHLRHERGAQLTFCNAAPAR